MQLICVFVHTWHKQIMTQRDSNYTCSVLQLLQIHQERHEHFQGYYRLSSRQLYHQTLELLLISATKISTSNDPKFFRQQGWANSIDPDQTSSLIRVYTVCHSVCIFSMHYSMVKPSQICFLCCFFFVLFIAVNTGSKLTLHHMGKFLIIYYCINSGADWF